jgi:hypothetical protein
MLTALENRVRKLESQIGGPGECRHGVFVVWPEEADRAPSGERICSICGLPRVVLWVEYDNPEADARLAAELLN